MEPGGVPRQRPAPRRNLGASCPWRAYNLLLTRSRHTDCTKTLHTESTIHASDPSCPCRIIPRSKSKRCTYRLLPSPPSFCCELSDLTCMLIGVYPLAVSMPLFYCVLCFFFFRLCTTFHYILHLHAHSPVISYQPFALGIEYRLVCHSSRSHRHYHHHHHTRFFLYHHHA